MLINSLKSAYYHKQNLAILPNKSGHQHNIADSSSKVLNFNIAVINIVIAASLQNTYTGRTSGL